jgi:heat-inducible transcriptional repressor
MMQDGTIENRVTKLEGHINKSDLEKLTNYLNEHIAGRTLSEFHAALHKSAKENQDRIQDLARTLLDKNILPSMELDLEGHIFIQGKSRLFEDHQAQRKIDEIRDLLRFLEEKKEVLGIMSALQESEGVRIFIGNDNPILQQPTWSTVIKGYHDQNGRVIGATGIIGPTRLNYSQIVPIVDYTTLIMEKMINLGPLTP